MIAFSKQWGTDTSRVNPAINYWLCILGQVIPSPPSFSALLCTLGCCCCHRCRHVGCCDDEKGDLCITFMCTVQYSWPVRVLTTWLVGRDTPIPDLGFELLALTLILLVTEGILWTETFHQAQPLYPPWLPKAYLCRQQVETSSAIQVHLRPRSVDLRPRHFWTQCPAVWHVCSVSLPEPLLIAATVVQRQRAHAHCF